VTTLFIVEGTQIYSLSCIVYEKGKMGDIMNKGLVLKVKDAYAILLTDEQEYIRVRHKNNLVVGKKIYFLKEDIYNSTNKSPRVKKQVLAFATVACLMLFAIIGGNITSVNPYALISIDINPSLELSINEEQVVTEIIPLNKDAENIFSDDMIGLNVLVVINTIIDNAEAQDYLSKKNNDILISSVTYKEDEADILSNMITEYLEENVEPIENVRIIYIESDVETAKEAKKSNRSLGKQELKQITKDDSTEDKTVTEIVEEDIATFEENVVLEDLDDLETSYLEFISKLSIVPDSDRNFEEISLFLDDVKKLQHENDIPIEYLADYPSLVLMKNRARDLWKLVQHDYQDELDQSHEDDSEIESDDFDALRNFVSRLEVVNRAGENSFDGFLENFEYNDDFSEFSIKSHRRAIDLFKEAKELWEPYKHKYQKIWDQTFGDDPEALEQKNETEELIDISEVEAWLDELYLTENNEIKTFVDEQRALLFAVKDEVSFKEVKVTVKEMYLRQKKGNKPNKDDQNKNDSDKNKGKGK